MQNIYFSSRLKSIAIINKFEEEIRLLKLKTFSFCSFHDVWSLLRDSCTISRLVDDDKTKGDNQTRHRVWIFQKKCEGLIIVMSWCWSVLWAVESLLRIDLLWVWRVGVSRLLLRINWHQILQVELFFLLALASQTHSRTGEKNRGDEFASDSSPSYDVRPIIWDACVVLQNLQKQSINITKETMKARHSHLATAGNIPRRRLFPFRRTQQYAKAPSLHLQEDTRLALEWQSP